MKRRWLAWVDLLSRREDGTALAAFRIAVGLVLTYSLLSIAAAGLVDVLWVDVAHGGYRPLGTGNWLVRLLGGPKPSAIWTLWTIAAVSAVGIVSGTATRVAAFTALQAYIGLHRMNGDTSGGYDLMITNALFLLVLARSDATLSVSCRRATGQWTCAQQVLAWPRYVAVFQLVVVYGATGLQKMSAVWTPGGDFSALYWVFQDPTWLRFHMEWTAWVFPLTQLMTATVWFWEVGAPLLLLVYYFRYTRDRPGRWRRWFNRWDLRKLFAAIGIGMHIGILIGMNVGPFSWISMSYYLCLWHPDEIRAAARRVLRRRTPAEAPAT